MFNWLGIISALWLFCVASRHSFLTMTTSLLGGGQALFSNPKETWVNV